MTGPIPRTRRRGTLVALAAMSLLILALASPASAAGKTINVNPVSGKNTNPGTAAAPLKTLGKALGLAGSGDTVKLAGGGYGSTPQGFGSGEQFPAGGLAVPSGVTIEGQTDNGFPVSTLLGQGSGAGLNLKGDATVRNLAFGFQGFAVSIFAKQGTQTLSNLFVPTNGKIAFVDGLPAVGGIALHGTAHATLLSGAAEANTTGTTFFVNGGSGINVRDQAQLTMRGGQINASQGQGVLVEQSGRFTLDGGTILGASGASCPSGTGVKLDDSAEATLTNQTKLTNLMTALGAAGSPKATLTDARITKAYTSGCVESASISARFGSASLTLDRSTLTTSGGKSAIDVGINTGENVALTLKQAKISGHAGAGLDLDGDGTVTADTSQLDNNKIGVDAFGLAGTTPQVRVNGSLLTRNDIAVLIRNGHLKLRNSRLTLNRIGVSMNVTSTASIHDSPLPPICVARAGCADLGTAPTPARPAGDPGKNVLTGNTEAAISFFATGGRFVGASAIGNVWNANTQGADAFGVYPQLLKLKGPTSGTNVILPANAEVDVGPASAVGFFKLSPTLTSARVGQRLPLTLSWTHPQSWRQLKIVELRLVRGGKPVGQVAFDVRSRTLKTGGAAHLARVKSFSRAGKGVKVAFALRIANPGRYALQLAATEKSGKRQAFAFAGSLQVVL